MTHLNRVTVLHPSMHFIGGAERLTVDLALGLADSATNVELVTGQCHNVWRSELYKKANATSVKELGQVAPGTLGIWLNVKGFARALSKLIDPETDIIVTSSFPSSLAAEIFTQKHRAKVVHYLHEAPMVLHDKEGLKSLPFRLRLFYQLMSFLYAKNDVASVKKSDMIIANSQLTKRANSEAYGVNESDIEVVYPGVNPERIAPLIALPEFIAKHMKESVPLIFIPRGAQLWRNPEICLQALKRLRTSFKAVFTGGADYEAHNLLKRARALGIADEVLWTKELSNQELSATYSHSSLIISIPRRQPFGLIPLESLIHGSPPIISRTSGVSEVLRDGVDAICIDESDSEELADAIEKLISDDETRRGIVSNGRRTVLEKLTLTRFVKEMKEKLVS